MWEAGGFGQETSAYSYCASFGKESNDFDLKPYYLKNICARYLSESFNFKHFLKLFLQTKRPYLRYRL